MMENLELHIKGIINEKLNRDSWGVPLDYFSWGRDTRHIVDNTERLPTYTSQKQLFRKVAKNVYFFLMGLVGSEKGILSRFRDRYASFDKSYRSCLMNILPTCLQN